MYLWRRDIRLAMIEGKGLRPALGVEGDYAWERIEEKPSGNVILGVVAGSGRQERKGKSIEGFLRTELR